MRPHRRSNDPRGYRNAGEDDSYDRRGGSHGHYSTSSTTSRQVTREHDSREAHYYRTDDVNVRSFSNTRQNWRSDERSREQSGHWEDRTGSGSNSERGGYVSEYGASRGYDDYRARSYAPTNWDQGNYANHRSYSHTNDNRNYGYNYNSTYGRTSPYGRNGGHSQDTYIGGSRSSNHSAGPSRHTRGDQRRNYHSSSSRPASGTNKETSGRGGPVTGSTATNLASQLFQHRENLTRPSPHRPIRNSDRTTLPRSPRLYSKNPPRRATPMRTPGPSEDYLKTSLEKSERAGREDENIDLDVNPASLVRKLLVLDLNGTLVYRSPHKRWHERFQAPDTTAIALGEEEDLYAQFDPSQPRPLRTVYPRPFLTSFRDYLFHLRTKQWLDTMVWSSAQPHSVGDMVDRCFEDRKGELVAIWARDKLGLNQSDYGRKVQTTKDLNKPWDELNSISSTTSQEANKHSAKTTLLLDDSPLKAHLQPYNHLCIKEYDLEMRKHDIGVREIDVARDRLADVISGRKGIEEVLEKRKNKNDENMDTAVPVEVEGDIAAKNPTSPTHLEHDSGDTRKRKRREKKENKKKEKIEQQLKQLTEGSENPVGVYDETLLAVVGILDAVKRESNVAAWVRAGGLIRSLTEGDKGEVREEGSASSPTSFESSASPRKKVKLTRAEPSEPEPAPAGSPVSAKSDGVESETERTGVPIEDALNVDGSGRGVKNVEEQLWFNHPGTVTYWASRGRSVLELMDIEAVVGVIGPTG